jgi:hypothetical protein
MFDAELCQTGAVRAAVLHGVSPEVYADLACQA